MIQLFRKLTDRIRGYNRMAAMKKFYVEYEIRYQQDVAHYFAIEIFATSYEDARKRLNNDIKIQVVKLKKLSR